MKIIIREGLNKEFPYEILSDYFSVTEEVNDGAFKRSFILPDGNFLVCSKPENGNYNTHLDTIKDIDKLVEDGTIPSEIKFEQYNRDSLIRCNGEFENYILLPKNSPTNSQLWSLEQWLNIFATKKPSYFPVKVMTPDAKYFVEYRLSNVEPKDVVSKVRRYYQNGKLEERLTNVKLSLQRRVLEDYSETFMEENGSQENGYKYDWTKGIVNSKGHVIVKRDEAEADAEKFISNITFEEFVEYFDFAPTDVLYDNGPAFITKNGQFYYPSEFCEDAIHQDMIFNVLRNYLLIKYEKYGLSGESLADNVADSAAYSASLDDFSRRLDFVRINTGCTESDGRFYSVIFQPLNGAQRYAYEDFLQLGVKNNKNSVLVYVLPDNNGEAVKDFSLIYNSASDIVDKINEVFRYGDFVENLNKKKKNIIVEGNKSMRFKLVENIESVRRMFPDIDDKTFNRLIRLDPTFNSNRDSVGTYGKWILNLAKKGNLDNEGHVTDLLTRFETNKKQLKNKDINKFKSLEDVDNYLNDEANYNSLSHRQEVRGRQKDRKESDVKDDLVFRGKIFDVYVPSSYANSCKLGQGTRWCTASTESDYYYNMYKDSYGGDYNILINRSHPDEKYQFHFESNQFMDADDDPVSLFQVLEGDEETLNFLSKKYDILAKLKSYSEKHPEIPKDVLLNFIQSLDSLKYFNVTEEEALKYIVTGFSKGEFVIFKDGLTDNVLSICVPELDMGDYLSDSLCCISKVKVLDGVKSLSDDDVSHLDLIEADFGNTLESLSGDWSQIYNVKLPLSLQDISRLDSFNAWRLRNFAFPYRLVENGALSTLLNIVLPRTIFCPHSNEKPVEPVELNLFTDNVKALRHDCSEYFRDSTRYRVNVYPYEEYDNYVTK